MTRFAFLIYVPVYQTHGAAAAAARRQAALACRLLNKLIYRVSAEPPLLVLLLCDVYIRICCGKYRSMTRLSLSACQCLCVCICSYTYIRYIPMCRLHTYDTMLLQLGYILTWVNRVCKSLTAMEKSRAAARRRCRVISSFSFSYGRRRRKKKLYTHPFQIYGVRQ